MALNSRVTKLSLATSDVSTLQEMRACKELQEALLLAPTDPECLKLKDVSIGCMTRTGCAAIINILR